MLGPILSPRTSAAEPADEVDFARMVRPILSENCFRCHGPDEAAREADLRLDTRSGLYGKEGDTELLHPGDASTSELFRRITAQEESELMPPPDSGRRLTAREISLIRRWINSGAKWSGHWSFQPIEQPRPPQVLASEWIRNPIDRFVLQRLSRDGLVPSPEAERHRLLRRVTLDLTGLPPTPEQLQAFLDDHAPGAYERAVDRLLASPHYGERMAWEWLDAARYADSNGYQGDRERTMWPWRDWVVESFNRNLPFDEFTVWQLAGDLLENPTFEQRLATGFCRNHMINGEGGRIPEENRVDYVFDMTETMGTVWLGLTLNCSRCHDHKYDPLLRREYYSFFAFFNQTPVTGAGGDPQTPPVIAVPNEEQSRKIQQLEQKLRTLDEQLRKRERELEQSRQDWEQRRLALEESSAWTVLTPREAKANIQTLTMLPDRSLLAGGPNPDNDTYVVTYGLSPGKITGLRLEALQHKSMTQGSLARSNSGNFVLTEIEVALASSSSEQPTPVPIASAEATFEQGNHDVAKAFDSNPQTGWAVYDGKVIDRAHAAIFQFKQPVDVSNESRLIVTLRHDSRHRSHHLGRFRISVTSAPRPKFEDRETDLFSAIKTPADQRTEEQKQQIVSAQQAEDELYSELKKQQQAEQKQLKVLRKSLPKVMIMADVQPSRETFMLERGLYSKPGEKVDFGVPASLPALPEDAPRNRLGLARWLVSDAQPLTARVTVNRFWQQFFGIGLVKTAEDFGAQGEIPEYQGLLDWLAADFRDHGWDVKRLVRQIVTSSTYRQSSRVSPQQYERDPQNRLLARGPRFRMPSWMLRDQALAVSGLLEPTLMGPPINGYQPPGVWEEATFGKKTYSQDHGAKLYRRSLYIFWRRIIAPTIFFDSASRQTCTVNQTRTNTPLHALTTFNDVTYVEAARVLAEKVLQSHETDDARLNEVFLRVLCRRPSDQEQAVLLAGLERSRRQFEESPGAEQKLLSMGESPRNQSLDPVEHASWTALCLAVLNFDETLTKE